MNVKAFVIRTEDDKALVTLRRKKACVSCPTGCTGCSKSQEHRAVVINQAGAKAGDIVLVEAPNMNLATAIIFIIPILLTLGAYFIFENLGQSTAAVLSLLTLVAGFAAMYISVGRFIYKFKKLIITKIISKDM